MNKKNICLILALPEKTANISSVISSLFDQKTYIKDRRLLILVIFDHFSAEINSTIKSLQDTYPDLYVFDHTVNNSQAAFAKAKVFALNKLNAEITIRIKSNLMKNPDKLRYRIWLHEWQEFIKYSIVGTSGAIVNMGTFIICTRLFRIPVEYASPVAIETAIISNFIFNSIWTFKKRTVKTILFVRFIRFHMVALIAGSVNYIILLMMVYGFGSSDILANIIGIVSAMIVNFILNSRWTWKRIYG